VTRHRGSFLSLLLIAVVAAALWYVSAPPKGKDGYLERVASTAETVRSQVQSARIWIETHGDGEAMGAATLVGLEEADEDAQSALSEFEGYEPAQGTLAVRDELVRLASAATDKLEAIRISAQLEDWDEVERVADELPPIADRLDVLEERTRP
jgi:hypothetical protein